MTFTYDGTPSTDLEKIRLEIGDTDSTAALFSDEEIQVKLDSEGSVLRAAAALCEILAARFSRYYDFETDGQSFKRSQMAEMYARRAASLRARAYSVTTVETTRVDGYSDDVGSRDVDETGTNPRRHYYGAADRIP